MILCPKITQVVLLFAMVGILSPAWGREKVSATTLKNDRILARFQNGLLVHLASPVGSQVYIDADLKKIPSVLWLGEEAKDVSAAVYTQTVSGESIHGRYIWPDGSTWELTWTLEQGDLVLRTASTAIKPVDRIQILFPGWNIERYGIVTVTNFGIGQKIQGPFHEVIGDPGSYRFNPRYVQPVVALQQGRDQGLWLEGRNGQIEPANILLYGQGKSADVAVVKGFPVPSSSPTLFEIRFRTYRGQWQDAVDPYIDWMEKQVGYLPLDRKSPAWVKDIRAQSYVPVGDINALERLAKKLKPSETLLGKYSSYRHFMHDVNYPDYRLTDSARAWIKRARDLGFHVAVHFNPAGISLDKTDLLRRFRPGLEILKSDATGKETYYGWEGPNPFADCSTAYKPWREFLIAQMKEAVDAGVDVIYIDESNTPTGKFLVGQTTAIQGVMALEKEILDTYPHVAVMTEQYNPMTSRHACFALTSLDLGHPLGGYIFHRFQKFILWVDTHYQTSDQAKLSFIQSWGYFVPGAETDPSWLQIARAFQDFRLDPCPKAVLNPHQLSAYSGIDGIKAFYEKQKHRQGLVVYPPNKKPVWFGARVCGVTEWSGPGALKDWPVYNEKTLLALNPTQSYVFDEFVALPADQFHIDRIPGTFTLHGWAIGAERSWFRIHISGVGPVHLAVPDSIHMVLADGSPLVIDRKNHSATLILKSPETVVQLLAFKKSTTPLVGALVDLPWQVAMESGSDIRQPTGYFLVEGDAFFNHLDGRAYIFGTFPAAKKIRLSGAFQMRDISQFPGAGVIRINGREILRIPAGPRPFQRIPFDIDLSNWKAQAVIIEISNEITDGSGAFATGDWYSPRISVE